jgi:predicted lactoylglutathione lyase
LERPGPGKLLRNEVLLLLSCECREEVDSLVAKAIAVGGPTSEQPEDVGFMYTHSFVGPDGHGGGLLHMSATPGQQQVV